MSEPSPGIRDPDRAGLLMIPRLFVVVQAARRGGSCTRHGRAMLHGTAPMTIMDAALSEGVDEPLEAEDCGTAAARDRTAP